MQPMKQRHKGKRQDWTHQPHNIPLKKKFFPSALNHTEAHNCTNLVPPTQKQVQVHIQTAYPLRWLSIHPILVKQNKHTQLSLQFLNPQSMFLSPVSMFGYPCFFSVVLWNISCVFCHPPQFVLSSNHNKPTSPHTVSRRKPNLITTGNLNAIIQSSHNFQGRFAL